MHKILVLLDSNFDMCQNYKLGKYNVQLYLYNHIEWVGTVGHFFSVGIHNNWKYFEHKTTIITTLISEGHKDTVFMQIDFHYKQANQNKCMFVWL